MAVGGVTVGASSAVCGHSEKKIQCQGNGRGSPSAKVSDSPSVAANRVACAASRGSTSVIGSGRQPATWSLRLDPVVPAICAPPLLRLHNDIPHYET